MQTFLRFFAGFIIVLVGIGLFLDNEFEVSREISIKASPAEIHLYVDDLNQWGKWSPWQQIDQSVVTTIGKITSGVGASQTWTDNGGGGSLTFTESSYETGIVYDLTFTGDSSVFVSAMNYKVEGENTIVRWTMRGKMEPIIIGNYFAQIMDALVGDNFELGLSNLKRVVERME